jgi:hypothetical protein
MYMADLVSDVNKLVETRLKENATLLSRNEVIEHASLDPRAFTGDVYIGEDFIAVCRRNARALDYYGGFEYVDDEDKATIGDYVFYSADKCDRVQNLYDDLCDLT